MDLLGRSLVSFSTGESRITCLASDWRAVVITARTLLVTGALLLLGTLPAHAATYYVSLSGNNGNSCARAQSSDNAKRSISAGVACLAPGDTLFIREGMYSGSNDVIDSARFAVPSGTSWWSPVTIAGYPGEAVTIKPPDGRHAVRLTDGAPSYLILQDFVIDMGNSSIGGPELEGIYLSKGAHHNRFQRLEIKYARSFGVVISKSEGNSSFNEVINCKIHHTGNGTASNTNGHGLYISTSDNLFDGNEVYENEGFGFHLYDDSGPMNINRNIITRNTIHDNGTDGGIAYGIVVAWGADSLVYENTIYRNRGGILVYSGAMNAAIYNNTIFGNAPLEAVALQYYASAPTVRYNSIYQNTFGVVDYGGNGTPLIDLLSGLFELVAPVPPPAPVDAVDPVDPVEPVEPQPQHP
jgi:parallel beta-helix repeat protein